MKTFWIICCSIVLSLHAATCEIEVLGSGGPELDGRASTSYLLWIDGKAKALIDTGSGAMLRFEESGAKLEDLDAVLLTHLHIDHAVDLPAFVKAGYFSRRSRPLPVVGPKGNASFPGMEEYLQTLFGKQGAYRYMQDVLTEQSDSFELRAVEVDAPKVTTLTFDSFTLDILNVHHGIVPALAFKITIDGTHSVIISGDTNNQDNALQRLAKGATLFIAHHAVSEKANPFAKTLHMTPSIIGKIAADANIQTLVLTHRMNRTIGKEAESLEAIRRYFNGSIRFADDHLKHSF